jgi:hypothetical protein
VEADIRYRFNFVVVGTKAKQVIEAVVNSKAANDLPGSVALASSNPKPEDETLRPMGSADSLDGSPRDSPRITSPRKRMLRQRLKNQTYRCLCKVLDPLRGEIAAKDDKEKPLLAKMVLRPLPLIEDVPLCSTHLEALSTVIVFLLQLDNKKNTIDEQLAMIHQATQRMRSRTRSKLRPVRAIMITQGEQGSAGSTEPEESWGPKLSEFEESYGKTWQFGPLNEVDGDALQATFGEMASVRIKQNEANEGTQMFNEEEEDVLLLESELELQDPEYAEKAAEERLVRALSGGSRPSETSSTTSEGAHRPPMFEAEFEGSQCSESAMELHARIFGLEDIPSQEAS